MSAFSDGAAAARGRSRFVPAARSAPVPAGGPSRRGTIHRPAIHEAGHVLAARILGFPVSSVDGAHMCYMPNGEHPDDLRAEAVVCMAGTAADVLAGQAQAVRGGPDLEQVAYLAKRLTDDPHAQLEEVRSALGLAINLLRANGPALRELAGTIAQSGAIVGLAAVDLAVRVALAQRGAERCR